MAGRDPRGGGQTLQAIRLDHPRCVVGEDLSDPSLLGTGEHGTAIPADRRPLARVFLSAPKGNPFGVLRRSVGSRIEEPAVQTLAWLRTVCLAAGVAACLVGCATAPIPPTYTQDELKAICERNGFRWYRDDLVGGFCERR